MHINDKMTIRQFVAMFSDIFPGLKIEFYKREHSLHGSSSIDDQYDHDIALGEITNNKFNEDIDIDPTKSVIELEQLFESKYGLFIQIFRKSNNIWLQTSSTDNWTLEVQNTKGLHSMLS